MNSREKMYIKSSRITLVKSMQNEYKRNKKISERMCNEWCVSCSCKDQFIQEIRENFCNPSITCQQCWYRFFDFLGEKDKRSNIEVYYV